MPRVFIMDIRIAQKQVSVLGYKYK